MDPEVPLIVPEVNPEAIKDHKGIIANPNCSTIIMMMAVKPLRDLSKIKRIVVSTYQAVSGAGKEGMAELEQQEKDLAMGKTPEANVLPVAKLPKHYQIASNAIPQIDIFLDNLYTKEEMKMVNETRKILGEPDEGEFGGQTRFVTMRDIFADATSIYKRLRFELAPDFTALMLMTDGVSDAKFETDANLNNIEKWDALWNDIQGENEDKCKVELTDDNSESQYQLMQWLNFYTKSNHDDRTIAILY